MKTKKTPKTKHIKAKSKHNKQRTVTKDTNKNT